MDWFKHNTGSHEDPDISEAWEEFGDAGPVVFWTILEVYGLEFNHLGPDGFLTLPVRYWERKLRRPWLKKGKTLEECWSSRGVDRGKLRSYAGVVVEFFRSKGRFEIHETPGMVSIKIPKFIKIASNWTSRIEKPPTEAPTEAPTQAPTAIEVEVEVEEEVDKNKDISLPPITPQKDQPLPKKEKQKEKERKTTMPDSFQISDRVRKWAAEKKFGDLEEHLEYFKSCCAAKGYEYINWDDAFMNAIRSDWAKIRRGGNNGVSTGQGTSGSQSKAPGTAGLARSDDRPYKTKEY